MLKASVSQVSFNQTNKKICSIKSAFIVYLPFLKDQVPARSSPHQQRAKSGSFTTAATTAEWGPTAASPTTAAVMSSSLLYLLHLNVFSLLVIFMNKYVFLETYSLIIHTGPALYVILIFQQWIKNSGSLHDYQITCRY